MHGLTAHAIRVPALVREVAVLLIIGRQGDC
jgi:hypothetical protein